MAWKLSLVSRTLDFYYQARWKLGLARRRLRWRPATVEGPVVEFSCNICGAFVTQPVSHLTRDRMSCPGCGSNLRHRAVVRALLLGLGEESGQLCQARNKSLTGIGVSDSLSYASRLARAFDYTNTYLHRRPRLDLGCPDRHYFESADFVIASDVLEHVAPPVATAFSNLCRILKPGGLLVLSVPIVAQREAAEHFPDLHGWTLESRSGKQVLVNRTAAGEVREYADLVFHGGPGETLEMRRFSKEWLLAELTRAGFVQARFVDDDCPRFGILWNNDPSTPLLARRPPV